MRTEVVFEAAIHVDLMNLTHDDDDDDDGHIKTSIVIVVFIKRPLDDVDEVFAHVI